MPLGSVHSLRILYFQRKNPSTQKAPDSERRRNGEDSLHSQAAWAVDKLENVWGGWASRARPLGSHLQGLLSSCLASVSVFTNVYCLFAVPRRVRGNQIIDFQAFPKKKRHLCEHTLTHTHSRTASILQIRSFPTTHVLI